jgi:integrase/recombinase XerD
LGFSGLSELLPIRVDTPPVAEERLIALVLNGVSSPHTRRSYRTGLVEFFDWLRGRTERPVFGKALVQEYRTHLESRVVGPAGQEGRRLTAATINLRMATLKKLALEMADNGLLDANVVSAIGRAKGVRQRGAKAGNWLGPAEASTLLRAPDVGTLKGIRDRAILAILLMCGLRRAELLRLRVKDLQQRDGRWVFLDLLGKGNRIRTVPVPTHAKLALDRWTTAAGIVDGYLFRPVNRTGVVSEHGIQDEKDIWRLVMTYARQIGLERLAPHDLRRTCAKLCRKNGGELEQIAFLLGHSSIQTTERYLGSEQELVTAVNDGMGLEFE